MEEKAELRAMWEFPATWKLVHLLSRPLSFSAPSPTKLENALLNPQDNMETIANIHGRLLRLTAGASSAKNWLHYTNRFVRHRPDDFTFLVTNERSSDASPEDSSDTEMKEEEVLDQVNDGNVTTPAKELDPSKAFPTDVQEYFQLRPSTRLLVMHTLVELVVSEHDLLLHAGSIADFDLLELRQYPAGTDALGNKYWYFGDCERVYREPGKKGFKTRRQQADDDAKVIEEAKKAAAVKAAKLAREVKRKEAERKREEIKRRREERKRKSMEKWAPRVAAARTTRASSRAEDHLLKEDRKGPSSASTAGSGKAEAMQIDSETPDQDVEIVGDDANPAQASGKRKSSAMNVERRTSGRRRRSTQESTNTPPRTPKRPRRTDRFVDPELRRCETWELASTGSDELRQLIDRFRAESGGVLSSEKALVRFLEEEVLPEILESEAKARKEQERQERKLRNELLFTVHKRSSRVQALEQKREEEARRIAEEEERERMRLQKIAERAECIRGQVADLEKEQSRAIRVARRAHGRTDAIERDDMVCTAIDRNEAKRDSKIEALPVRRSTRRGTRQTLEGDDSAKSRATGVVETDSVSVAELNGADAHEPEEKTVVAPVTNNAVQSEASGVLVQDHTDKPSDGEKDKENSLQQTGKSALLGSSRRLEGSPENGKASIAGIPDADEGLRSKRSEASVGDLYTWSVNPEDKEPIRVLDKFFFASKGDFIDAPLETCDTKQWDITGYGILLPAPDSTADAGLVEIDSVEDWSIEYGAEPKLWVKSRHAWYELRDPSVEYSEAYVTTRRKYELCIRISILGATYKAAELSYSAVVELLSYRYEGMLSYKASDILDEKRFIVSQMESLGRRSILQSGFMRELKRKVKAEDLKAVSENRSPKAAQQKLDPDQKSADKTIRVIADTVKAIGPASSPAKNENKKPVKPRAKRRLSSIGRPVPRPVSSIISGLLRAATKPRSQARKRKRKQDVLNENVVRRIEASLKSGMLNGVHGKGRVVTHDGNPMHSARSMSNTFLSEGKGANIARSYGRPIAALPARQPGVLQTASGEPIISTASAPIMLPQSSGIQQSEDILERAKASPIQVKPSWEKVKQVSEPFIAPRTSPSLVEMTSGVSQRPSHAPSIHGNAECPYATDAGTAVASFAVTGSPTHLEVNGMTHTGMNGSTTHVNTDAD